MVAEHESLFDRNWENKSRFVFDRPKETKWFDAIALPRSRTSANAAYREHYGHLH
jgi:hypothetical protein